MLGNTSEDDFQDAVNAIQKYVGRDKKGRDKYVLIRVRRCGEEYVEMDNRVIGAPYPLQPVHPDQGYEPDPWPPTEVTLRLLRCLQRRIAEWIKLHEELLNDA